MWLLSSDNSSSTNKTINSTHSVSTASSKDQASTASYTNDVIFSFFANRSNASQLDYKDLEQIDADDLEEMDLKWQVAMLTMRVKRFIKKTRRKMDLNEKETVGFDWTKVECYNCHRRGQFVRECMTPCSKKECYKCLGCSRWDSQISAKDKAGLGYDSQMNKSEVVHSVFNSRESDVDDSLVNDRFKTSEGFHSVPTPYTGNYMPSRPNLSFAGLDDSVYKTKVSETETSISKDIIEKSKTVRPSTPIIEEWDTDSDYDSVFRPKYDQINPKFTKINFVKSNENVKSVNKENTHRQVEYSRKSQSPRDNRRNWNGMMTQKLGNGFESIKKACFVCGSLNHLIKDYDFLENKMVEKPVLNNKGRVTGKREIRPVWNNAQRVNHQNKLTHPYPKRNFVPTAVATKSGQVPVNAAKQNSPRAAASISTAMPVNTAAPKPQVNDALPATYSYFKGHSPVRRAFNQKPAAKTNNFNSKVNTARVNNVTTVGPKAVVSATMGNRENAVKSLVCWIWRPTGNVIDNKSKDSGSYMLKRFDYVDLQGRLNGCPRHMIGNKSFLIDYQEIDGGFVAFGGSPKGGKITKKAKIRTRKLDFEYVYFVKELKFNLFSVSQMCDKKNSVLFTETECLVLSPDFKLLDESQVLLKVPRQNNMYSYVVPLGVTKPHNKTPFEQLHGRPHSISLMRPFECPMTILNTLDPVGKFDGKDDEGFFVGYSINSKAFRVFNTRTRKVEENLHITFLKNKPNVAGSGPDWLFDIDLLTNSMNYEPVTAGNQTNRNEGIKDNVDAIPTQQYILLPLLYDSPQSLEDAVVDDAGKKTNEEPTNEGERNYQENEGGASNKEDDQNVQDFRVELDNLLVQHKEGYANITNRVSTVSPFVSAARQSFNNADLPTDPLIPNLEDTTDLLNTGIFSGAYDNEDEGVEADLNNLETTMNVSPISTTRIHKDHPKDQIIGDINSATQIRRMTKIFKEHAMKVWRLVDLPKGKHAIGTKWVYRNKKDKRGILVRNKARLVAQGYTQEEGIGYDEVLLHPYLIEIILTRLEYGYLDGLSRLKDEDELEDPSKQGRKISQIDEDEGITLVQMSAQTQGRHEHDFKFIALEEDYTAEPDISTANVSFSTAGAEVSTASA
ncbi:ribonuclease H-like domain-containing protein [Tanacetum coccineum]